MLCQVDGAWIIIASLVDDIDTDYQGATVYVQPRQELGLLSVWKFCVNL